MPTSQIQATVDAIAAQQVPNQFGSQRYALLFKPGTYGTAQNPLNFQVGYYTSVAGLGAEPGDVAVNGSIYVRNQCAGIFCTALNNFWRSLSNLTINVNNPSPAPIIIWSRRKAGRSTPTAPLRASRKTWVARSPGRATLTSTPFRLR